MRRVQNATHIFARGEQRTEIKCGRLILHIGNAKPQTRIVQLLIVLEKRREIMNAQIDPIAVSMTEAARLMSVSRPTIYAWSKTEGFPIIKINGCSRVLVDGLREWARWKAGVTSDYEQ